MTEARRRETRVVVSIDELRSIALALPGAEERASYGGQPSWRTRTRMFAWVRDDPEALVVWVDSEEEKHALVTSEPAKFFTTPHYHGQPIVLVRLEVVDRGEAAELLEESWRLRAPRALVREWDERTS